MRSCSQALNLELQARGGHGTEVYAGAGVADPQANGVATALPALSVERMAQKTATYTVNCAASFAMRCLLPPA